MDKSLYISMTGASQNALAQRSHANNLANLTTLHQKAGETLLAPSISSSVSRSGATVTAGGRCSAPAGCRNVTVSTSM